MELRTGHDAALCVLWSPGRATVTARPSGCASEEEVALGVLLQKKKSLRRCCAKDERQMLEDPAAARETNEHSG